MRSCQVTNKITVGGGYLLVVLTDKSDITYLIVVRSCQVLEADLAPKSGLEGRVEGRGFSASWWCRRGG